MKYDLENSKLKLLKGTELIFDIDFKNIVKSISEDNKQDRIKLPTESLSFVYTNKPYEMKLIFDSIYGEIESNKINRVYFSGAVLVKKDVK